MKVLILALLCSSGIALTMKAAPRFTRNNIALLLVNYSIATIVSVISAGLDGSLARATDSIGVLGFAVFNGIIFISAFVLMQTNIRINGATIAAAVSRMGVLIPVVLSIVIFRQYPHLIQGIGLIVALAALALISYQPKSKLDTPHIPGTSAGIEGIDIPDPQAGIEGAYIPDNAGNTAASKSLADADAMYDGITTDSERAGNGGRRWLLLPMLLAGGMADMDSKIFEANFDNSMDSVFVGATFLVALVICIGLYVKSGEKLCGWDIALGTVLGVFNQLSTLLLVKALMVLPAYLCYTTYALGVILVVNVVNLLLMHEKLARKDYAAMVLIMIAIAMLNR